MKYVRSIAATYAHSRGMTTKGYWGPRLQTTPPTRASMAYFMKSLFASSLFERSMRAVKNSIIATPMAMLR